MAAALKHLPVGRLGSGRRVSLVPGDGGAPKRRRPSAACPPRLAWETCSSAPTIRFIPMASTGKTRMKSKVLDLQASNSRAVYRNERISRGRSPRRTGDTGGDDFRIADSNIPRQFGAAPSPYPDAANKASTGATWRSRLPIAGPRRPGVPGEAPYRVDPRRACPVLGLSRPESVPNLSARFALLLDGDGVSATSRAGNRPRFEGRKLKIGLTPGGPGVCCRVGRSLTPFWVPISPIILYLR